MIEDKLHSKPLVSVLVLDYNGQRFWPELLVAIEGQTFRDFELVVVQNGGPLQIPANLGEIPVRLLKGQGNLGFAGGVNFAASRARGKYLALLNNDAVPERDWLQELVSALEADPKTAAVCGKVLFYDRYVKVEIEAPLFRPDLEDGVEDDRWLGVQVRLAKRQASLYQREGTHRLELIEGEYWVWTEGRATLYFPVAEAGELPLQIGSHRSQSGKRARFRIEGGDGAISVELEGARQELRLEIPNGASFDLVNGAGSEFTEDWSLRELGLYQKDGPEFSRPKELEMGSGCSLLLRRAALTDQPFDEEFFAYFEDSDLCLRLRRSGWKVLFAPRSVVRHHGSATTGVLSAMTIFYSLRNRVWLVAKFAPWPVVWRTVREGFSKYDKFDRYLSEPYSLSRLKREIWTGLAKRLWRRWCDDD
ncbi:glycosyltransferase family 2 protein [Pelagicoccus sp. SDUM812005]|uniref:glycosyltransferase family 2 protein n=1 Tax=Pelagicoccus sp. SDUM812005 TaxID=3041257 RepID=UPI0028107B27|nr:glycosyltransferase family 2 protein [Pelagicoccus sp. SDUM812005]MDQ8181325.1 glycosyltransferase family 2 protein [Pelagicoccus sp. SDUM812005]